MSQNLATPRLLDPVAWKSIGATQPKTSGEQIQRAFARLFSRRLHQGGLFADHKTTDSLVQACQNNVADGVRSGRESARAHDASPLRRFRAAIQDAGLDENRLVVRADDRPLVEAVLRKSGLDQDTTRRVVDQATLPNGSIHLGKIFKAVESLRDGRDAQLLIPEAFRPIVVQLLTQLGLDPEKINTALSKLTVKNGSIDLKRLMSFLETLGPQKHVIDPQTLRQLFSGLGLGEDQIKSLLAGRGGSDDPMTGARLAALLRRAGLAQAQGDEDVDALLAKLAAKLNLSVSAEGMQTTTQDKLLASFKAKMKFTAEAGGDRQKLQQAFTEIIGRDTAELTGRQLEQLLSAQVKEPGMARSQVRAETDARTTTGVRDAPAASPKTASAPQTAAAEAPRTQVRPLPQVVAARVVRQVSAFLGQMVLRGPNRITVRLVPPNLGELHLNVVFKDGAVSGHILAESQAVKQAIEANLAELKQQLADQGVNVDRFEVDVRQQPAGSGDNESGGRRTASGDGEASGQEAGAGPTADELAESMRANLGRGGRYINLLA
ncbi:MAG: flagellar hook-length control protein FliK [Proteobacteria bacterium]|nr:flagellar hook-length control protein FliK [Pseudomonadota bacterium]MBU1741757.1 flagellar hook-length control protein FliK [Pseudomonadota bacterium]